MKKVFKLKSENLTNLGGMMGTEYTYENWSEFFTTIRKCKERAEEDYKKKIDWIKTTDGFRSSDLLYVMYHIEEIKIK